MSKKHVVVLGSTGSIGESAFRVFEAMEDYFDVIGLVARNNITRLAEQSKQLHCREVITTDEAKVTALQGLLPPNYYAAGGDEAVLDLVCRPEVDVVLCAIVGTGGLRPVLAALQAGKTVALASKEVLVMAGELVMGLARNGHGKIIPVDSEHSAIFQCLAHRSATEVENLILTASGGAFRNASKEEITKATVEHALAHPVWSMGPKVTIDSATMMNKALEIIEAGYLFGMSADNIKVVIHPESVVHSMVELKDGTLIAQLANPDMRYAIQYALTYPDRVSGGLPKMDLNTMWNLHFMPPDHDRLPSLKLAEQALRRGGTLPAVLNAANEVAVSRFKAGSIRLPDIWAIIRETMKAHRVEPQRDLQTILRADAWARDFAQKVKCN